MIINDNQSDNHMTINQLSNDYHIDNQRIRRYIKKYHAEKLHKGNNNAWLIDNELKEIILEHFGIDKRDNHSDNQNDKRDNQNDNQNTINDNHYERLIIELNNRIADKDKALADKDSEIAFLRKKLDDEGRRFENQQMLMAQLSPPKKETVYQDIKDDAEDVIAEDQTDEMPKKGLFGRIFWRE